MVSPARQRAKNHVIPLATKGEIFKTAIEKARSSTLAMSPTIKGPIVMERPSELSIGPPQFSQLSADLSPGTKKKKAVVDLETEKLWA